MAFGLSLQMSTSAQTMIDIANDSTDPRNLRDAEPSIAINPRDPRDISIVTFSEPWGAGTLAPVWRSMDGGVTWAKIRVIPQPPSNGSGPGDQHLGYDAQGNLYLAELDFDENYRTFN